MEEQQDADEVSTGVSDKMLVVGFGGVMASMMIAVLVWYFWSVFSELFSETRNVFTRLGNFLKNGVLQPMIDIFGLLISAIKRIWYDIKAFVKEAVLTGVQARPYIVGQTNGGGIWGFVKSAALSAWKQIVTTVSATYHFIYDAVKTLYFVLSQVVIVAYNLLKNVWFVVSIVCKALFAVVMGFIDAIANAINGTLGGLL